MLTDIVFTEGEVQNFLLEVGGSIVYSPIDIQTESNSNPGMLCLETPEIVDIPSPDVVLLSDGKLARKISDKFYIKM